MYISILTGHVAKENWTELQKAYGQALRKRTEGMLQSLLIQMEESPDEWQIISIWDDLTAFLNAKDAKITDTCVQLFCDAGSVPIRKTFQVRQKYQRV